MDFFLFSHSLYIKKAVKYKSCWCPSYQVFDTVSHIIVSLFESSLISVFRLVAGRVTSLILFIELATGEQQDTDTERQQLLHEVSVPYSKQHVYQFGYKLLHQFNTQVLRVIETFLQMQQREK